MRHAGRTPCESCVFAFKPMHPRNLGVGIPRSRACACACACAGARAFVHAHPDPVSEDFVYMIPGHMTKSRGRKSFFLLFFFFSWGRQGERVEEGTLVRYLSLGGFQEEEGNTWNAKVL